MPVAERHNTIRYLDDMGHYTDWVDVKQCYSPLKMAPIEEPESPDYHRRLFIQLHPYRQLYQGKVPERTIARRHFAIRQFFSEEVTIFINSPSSFAPQLPEIETAIHEARYITSLPDNWDEEGAAIISQETFDKFINFLRTYCKYLFQSSGIKIEAPEINPCKDGTIDLSWHTSKARMLINIRKHDNEYLAFYYGDLYNNKMPIKGNVPVDEFSESLAVWMKYLV